MTPIIVDFETDGIVGNPLINPPKPCGVSIKWPGHPPCYFAWGHPTKNNCNIGNAKLALRQAIESGLPICFHNAGFDISVWEKWFAEGYWDRFDWRKVHDTLYLVFLADPYASSFSLKPSAERWLDMPPEEQNELRDWILANIQTADSKNWASYISLAPGDLVGKYANGDTLRTDLLFQKLHASIVAQGMQGAYDRERRMFPVTLRGTQRGVRCNRARLERDTRELSASLENCEGRLCDRLGITQYQLEDDEEALKDGLTRSGAVTEWVLTPKSGKRSMSADNLNIVIPDIKELIEYRGALKTSLQTFMRPWLEMSRADGRLHPNWNQVRQAKGDYSSKGTRTGRLSSDDPNFQNLPTEWMYGDGTPMAVPFGLLPYPILRSYILPEVDHVWLKRDFSAQEIRIAAHYEDGALAEAFRVNPNLDPHKMAQEIIAMMFSYPLSRKPTKVIGFSIIYGAGAPGTQLNLRKQAGMFVSIDQARELKSIYLSAMPGIKDLMTDVQLRGKTGMGIRTWGGRVYYSEPPKGGRDFHYKLLNYLIQGSAADQTKQCINEWDDAKGDAIFLATVHDEINISAPRQHWQLAMTHLRQVMEKDRFGVPFKSEGFVGSSWADLKECA
jgi:DNA polymerase I-like protein with 3'-5' exonuclease and polymerase domains